MKVICDMFLSSIAVAVVLCMLADFEKLIKIFVNSLTDCCHHYNNHVKLCFISSFLNISQKIEIIHRAPPKATNFGSKPVQPKTKLLS